MPSSYFLPVSNTTERRLLFKNVFPIHKTLLSRFLVPLAAGGVEWSFAAFFSGEDYKTFTPWGADFLQQERRWMYLAQAWLIHSSGDVRAISILTQNPDRHPPRTSTLCLQGAFKKLSPSPLFLRQRRYDSGHKGTHQSHSAFWNHTLCASNLFLASRAKYTITLATERTQTQVLQAIFPGVRTRTYDFIFQDFAQLWAHRGHPVNAGRGNGPTPRCAERKPGKCVKRD